MEGERFLILNLIAKQLGMNQRQLLPRWEQRVRRRHHHLREQPVAVVVS